MAYDPGFRRFAYHKAFIPCTWMQHQLLMYARQMHDRRQENASVCGFKV